MPKFIINEQLKGVELYFDRMPSEKTRIDLKSQGWRWSRAKKCWYNKKTDNTLKYAENICGVSETKKPHSEPSTDNKARPKTIKPKSDPIQVNQWVEDILTRIRNNDPFPELDRIHSKNLELMDHQKAGAIIAERYNRFAFFYDTGTGKTAMTLNIIADKYNLNKTKFLIIAPKPLIKNAWLEQAGEYFPDMRILPLSSNISFEEYKEYYDKWLASDGKKFTWDSLFGSYKSIDRIKDNVIMRAQHYIINLEQLRTKELSEIKLLIRKTGVTGVIIDESAILKNYDSKSSQLMREMTKSMDYVYLLSGKPAPNSPLEFFSQMKIVDPDTFSMSFEAFLDRYFMPRGKYRYVFKNQYSERDVTRMIGQRSIIVRKEECLSLPEKVSMKRRIDLDSKTRTLYTKVWKNFITEIISMDGQSVMTRSMSKMARIAKLREIACGFYLDENARYYVSSEKKETLISLLEDEIGTQEQVLIWCNFQYEIETIEKELRERHCSVVTAYGKSKNVDDNIQKFKNGAVQYMIAHPKTLKYGVTFTNCHYAVYNSLSYSLEDYYQSCDRIYRAGQTNRCFYYHLLTQDTIDELIYKNINDKHMSIKVFEDLIKKSSRFGVDKILIERATRIKPQAISTATMSINTD